MLSRLRAWKESPGSSHLCLDLRSLAAYQARHLVPSVNIPWQQLSQRCAELPPKTVPFAVVQSTAEHNSAFWLKEHGWDCPWVFDSAELTDAFWSEACQAGWADTQEAPNPTLDTTYPKPWLLFKPCPLLCRHIAMVEQNRSGPLNCLDIGCGSGRDTAWLLSRSAPWHVTAIDSLKGAVERTDALAAHLGVRDRLTVKQAKIMANGAWKTIEGATLAPLPTDKTARFAPGEPTAEFFSDAKFDLILTIRFLVRSLLPELPALLKNGGYLFISHFVQDNVHTYDQPRMDHRLALGELAALYGSMEDIRIVSDIIEEIEDGRPVNSIILQKI